MKPIPRRFQRRRTKGWRKPPGAINCTRPGRYGNPYYPGCGIGMGHIGEDGQAYSYDNHNLDHCVRMFRLSMRNMRQHAPSRYFALLEPLRGRDLMCTCGLKRFCHVDVLLVLANDPDLVNVLRCEAVS